MRNIIFCITYTLLSFSLNAQDMSYVEIPKYPETYTAGTVAARLVDGLGFRFYWATEKLAVKEIEYRLGDESRSITETVDHIYALTTILANTVLEKEEKSSLDLPFEDKRRAILKNLWEIRSVLILSNDADLENFTTEFSNGSIYPFWNMINGPIADCLWHCGQIVMIRRLAGNPINPKVSVFSGSSNK